MAALNFGGLQETRTQALHVIDQKGVTHLHILLLTIVVSTLRVLTTQNCIYVLLKWLNDNMMGRAFVNNRLCMVDATFKKRRLNFFSEQKTGS